MATQKYHILEIYALSISIAVKFYGRMANYRKEKHVQISRSEESLR